MNELNINLTHATLLKLFTFWDYFYFEHDYCTKSQAYFQIFIPHKLKQKLLFNIKFQEITLWGILKVRGRGNKKHFSDVSIIKC